MLKSIADFFKSVFRFLRLYYLPLFISSGVLLVIAVSVVLWLDTKVMPEYTRSGLEFPIPDIVGMNLDSARTVIEADSFKVSDEIIKKVDSQITLTGARYYTEAADLQEAGINTIVFGAGSIVQAHQVDEYVEVKELEYVEKVYTEIFKRLR